MISDGIGSDLTRAKGTSAIISRDEFASLGAEKNVLESMRLHPTSFSWETGTTEASNKETEYVLPSKGNGPEFVRGTLFGNGMISEFCCIHSFSFIAVSESLFFCRARIKGFGF